MNEVPDYVSPVVGWRLWEVQSRGDEPVLRSLVRRDCRWPARRPLVAECPASRLPGPRDRHPAPGEGCWCGVHAFKDQAEALRTMCDIGPELDGPLVVGTVAMWGRVVDCEHGYRAERAYPAQLWVPYLDGRRRGRDVVDRLLHGLHRYGAPVRPLALKGWAVAPGALTGGGHPAATSSPRRHP
jgi:hypothetical protein